VKKLAEIPDEELSPSDPCKRALALSKKSSVGKFMELWPNPKVVESWIMEQWTLKLQGQATLFAVGRGFCFSICE